MACSFLLHAVSWFWPATRGIIVSTMKGILRNFNFLPVSRPLGLQPRAEMSIFLVAKFLSWDLFLFGTLGLIKFAKFCGKDGTRYL
ncbi:hypothetical protein Nmel_001607 [Mimus melanotis]